MKCIATVVCLSLFALPAVADERPIAAAVASTTFQAAPAPPKTRMKSVGLYATGIALAGVGGYMLGYGLAMESGASCFVDYYGYAYCEEIGKNRNLYIGAGAALSAAGLWMGYAGSRRVTVAPTPSLTGASIQYHVWPRSPRG